MAKIPKHDHRRTCLEEQVYFHYKVSGNLVFLCVADRDLPARICFAFLDDIEARLLERGRDSLEAVLRERMVRCRTLSPATHGQALTALSCQAFHSDMSRGASFRLKTQTEQLGCIMETSTAGLLPPSFWE